MGYDTTTLTAGASGVTIESIRFFCNKNNIELVVLTTDTLSGIYTGKM